MLNEMDERHVTLDWLAQGAAMEMWQDELQKVLDNIADPNTKATATRAITLTVTFKPDDNRRYAPTVIECKSKVAPVRGHATAIYMGRKQGKIVATEYDDRQEELPGAKVSDIAAAKNIGRI
jgi:hypothetical protein